jgi:sugar O-acyltransferase (sialic acid O-acetyltransferase NeuD family)
MRYLVIGAAGHAQEVAWSLREAADARGERVECLFFDDRVPAGPLASGLGVVGGGLERVPEHAEGETALVMGLGLPATKEAVAARLAPLGLPWATVVHPRATLGPNVEIGAGGYVAAGAILTVNVRVGRFATVNMHCQVAHDGVLGDFVTLHSDVHLAGGVTIGDRSELGTGAIVIPGITLGPATVLGAGCVVVRALAGGGTWVGVPARRLPAHDPPRRSITPISPGASRTRTKSPPPRRLVRQ